MAADKENKLAHEMSPVEQVGKTNTKGIDPLEYEKTREQLRKLSWLPDEATPVLFTINSVAKKEELAKYLKDDGTLDIRKVLLFLIKTPERAIIRMHAYGGSYFNEKGERTELPVNETLHIDEKEKEGEEGQVDKETTLDNDQS